MSDYIDKEKLLKLVDFEIDFFQRNSGQDDAITALDNIKVYVTDGRCDVADPVRGRLVKSVSALVRHIERNACLHEETERRGIIWEKCRQCGRMWADDEGGKPEFEWPPEVEEARTLLSELEGK